MGKFGYHTIPRPTMRVRYNGLFDFDTLYAAIIDWGKNYGYKLWEKGYKHKVPSPKGAEQTISIDFTKSVNEFVKFQINVVIHTWDMTEVNVDVGGRKKQLTNSRIEIKINPVVYMDWQNKFKSKSKFVNQLSEWYLKIMAPTLEVTYVDGLHYRAVNFQAMIKKYFDLQAKAHPYVGYLGEN